MQPKIVTYSVEDLERIVKNASAGRSREAWLSDMRAKIVKMLKDRPATYRTFGPWWWPLKSQLIERGDWPGSVDPDDVAQVTTGSQSWDMAAAVAYHGASIDELRDGNTFQVDTADGDTIDYVLFDQEMEGR